MLWSSPREHLVKLFRNDDDIDHDMRAQKTPMPASAVRLVRPRKSGLWSAVAGGWGGYNQRQYDA
jgi:hypothetical protein